MWDHKNEDRPGRYGDPGKFITDPDKLELDQHALVYISAEEDYDIAVDLEGQEEKFDALRPFIAFVAKNICRLDDLAQRFDAAHGGNGYFRHLLAIVFVDEPYVIFEYWSIDVNSTFDVVFHCEETRFVLESFGTLLNLPPDWSVEFA